jgi:hypothetical protein
VKPTVGDAAHSPWIDDSRLTPGPLLAGRPILRDELAGA